MLLKWLQKKNLTVLGFLPTRERLKFIVIGFLLPVAFFSFLFITLSYFVSNPFVVNPGYTLDAFFSATWYQFKSVAFETLIFHGALLFILMERIGWKKAAIISAITFGIYHWFSWNLFGQVMPMITVFITTGIYGFLWALAFVRSKTIYLPFTMHLGLNFVNSIMFSKDKNMGEQLMIPANPVDPVSPGNALSLFLILLYFAGLPSLTLLYLSSVRESELNIHFPDRDNIKGT